MMYVLYTVESTTFLDKIINFIASIDFGRDILIPLISAFIFWFIFSFIPNIQRQKLYRKKILVNLYQIQIDLFSIFSKICTYKEFQHLPGYQQKIRSGLLTEDELKEALSIKCVSSSYLTEPISQSLFHDISEFLSTRSSDIIENIDRIFYFYEALGNEEIIILEDIRTYLKKYSLDDNNAQILKYGMVPDNPNISSMTKNLLDLYDIFLKIQDITLHEYESRESTLARVNILYSKKEFKKCIKETKKAVKTLPKDNQVLLIRMFFCLDSLGKEQDALKYFNKVMELKPNIVSWRSLFKEINKDSKYWDIIKSLYTEEDIKEYHNCLKEEEQVFKLFKDDAEKGAKYSRDEVLKQNT